MKSTFTHLNVVVQFVIKTTFIFSLKCEELDIFLKIFAVSIIIIENTEIIILFKIIPYNY